MKQSRAKCAVAVLGFIFTFGWPTDSVLAEDALDIKWTEYSSVDGERISLDGARWTVVCFLGAECPLARLYGPRLNAMADKFKDRGVRFVGINSNSHDSIPDIQNYVKKHEITFPIVRDHDQSLAQLFHASRTPQVFVLDAKHQVCYQGRIDDQYEPGLSRTSPTRHDLRDAIEACLAGSPIRHPVTIPVGCLITFVERPEQPTNVGQRVTFTRDIAPILNRHCVECHRPNEIGPFALTEYQEVVGWSEMMLEVIKDGRMPPWHADPEFGKFVGQRHLPGEARDLLAAWVRQGMPEGDPEDLPPRPPRALGWHLNSKPDVVFSMRDRPFHVPADGIVEYQYFVVDPKWTEDRWVRAAQVAPGNAAVVHHSIVFVRPPDGSSSRGIGWLGAYVPGQRTAVLPSGHARRIPAGSKLVFQMHYTPNGRETSDRTRVGVWFRDPDEVTHEVVTRVALNHDFEIGPGESNCEVEFRLDDFSRESRLLSATPHMHLRGKSFRLESRRGSQRRTLLHVPRYDFNWQHWYQFESPLDLDEVDALDMRVCFDNSPSNPVNPAPDEYVTWGDQTGEEMAVAFLDIAHPRGKPRVSVARSEDAEPVDAAARRQRIRHRVNDFLAKMDGDGDGVIIRDEAPVTFRRFGFRQMDTDRNGRLERNELEAAAGRRE